MQKKVGAGLALKLESNSDMSSSIVQPSAFSVSKVSISAPKVLDSGGKLAYVNYGDARSLVLQTPSLQSPFGLNVFDKNGPPKYSLDLALRGYNGASPNPKVKSFYDALSSLDEHMIDLGVKNSKLWFKADMKREVVQAFYTPTVKFGRDKEGNQTPYPPNVKLQLRRTRDGAGFESEFYDEKSKSNPNAKPIKDIPVEEMLVKKVEVTALMQCTGVWFAGGKYGLSWKAVQVRLDSVPSGLRGNAFVNDEDGEFSAPAPRGNTLVEDEDHEAAPAPARASQPAPAQAEAEDEDEEVAPAPVPKKKVVTVKKATTGK
jgi:hypothetical protein